MAVVAGLTGGYGSGKSTVLKMFQAHEWMTMSADAICRDLYDANDPRLISAMTERWGKKFLTRKGDINRAAIADIVFNDDTELEFLNGLLHPIVKEQCISTIVANRGTNIIVEVPLLYEVEWIKVFNAIIAVWCPFEKTLENLETRDISPEEYARRIKSQISPDVKLERADYGLINSGNLIFLKQQVAILINQLTKGKNNA